MKNFIHTHENQFPDELCDRLVALFEQADKMNVTRKGTSGTGSVSDAKKQSSDVDLHDGFVNGASSFYLRGKNKHLYSEIRDHIDKPILQYVNANIPNFLGETDYLELEYSKNIFIPTQPFKLKRYRAPSEGYHAWHQDWGVGTSQKRMLVAMIYLNDVEEGGETAFFHQELKIKPKKGTLVIFPPYFTHMHKGFPPTSNDKYICNCYIGIAEAVR